MVQVQVPVWVHAQLSAGAALDAGAGIKCVCRSMFWCRYSCVCLSRSRWSNESGASATIGAGTALSFDATVHAAVDVGASILHNGKSTCVHRCSCALISQNAC